MNLDPICNKYCNLKEYLSFTESYASSSENPVSSVEGHARFLLPIDILTSVGQQFMYQALDNFD